MFKLTPRAFLVVDLAKTMERLQGASMLELAERWPSDDIEHLLSMLQSLERGEAPAQHGWWRDCVHVGIEAPTGPECVRDGRLTMPDIPNVTGYCTVHQAFLAEVR